MSLNSYLTLCTSILEKQHISCTSPVHLVSRQVIINMVFINLNDIIIDENSVVI